MAGTVSAKGWGVAGRGTFHRISVDGVITTRGRHAGRLGRHCTTAFGAGEPVHTYEGFNMYSDERGVKGERVVQCTPSLASILTSATNML